MDASIQRILTELKSELLDLQGQIDEFRQEHGKDSGLSSLLRCIEQDLAEDPPRPALLEEDAFGIFRLVTDSLVLEKSGIGMQLMQFRKKLREFAAILQQRN